MRHLLVALLIGGLLAGPLKAEAAAVVVSGTEWRQLTETTNFSWEQVSTVCSSTTGACSGSLGAVSFDGWTWASNTDVRALFEQLIKPGTTEFLTDTWNYVAANDPDIDAAIGSGKFNATVTGGSVEYVQGWSRTSGASAGSGQLPTLYNVFLSSGNDFAALGNLTSASSQSTASGVWLYRDIAPVPLPAAAWLLLSGLGGLGFMGRRRKAA